MKYGRTYNFSAGPATMPEPVLEEIRDEMMNYRGSGMCVMEMSHRSKVFQQIVDEAMMFEPTETESKASIDRAVEAIRGICKKAYEDPEELHGAPHHAPIGRPDEVTAARHPVVRFEVKEEE